MQIKRAENAEGKAKNQGLLRGVKQALEWVIGPHRGTVPV